MKRFLFVLSFLLTLSFAAQGQLRWDHGKILRGDKVLSEQEILDAIGNEVYEETYVGALRQRNAGRGLVISGGVVTAVGLGAYIGSAYGLTQGNKGFYPLGVLSIGTMAIGSTLLAVGIPLLVIGNKRLHWVVDNANQQPMIITPAPSGVGLCLNF